MARGLLDDDRLTVDLGPRPPVERPATDEPASAEETGEPRRRRPTSGATSILHSAESTAPTPRDAMRADELARSRIFAKVVLGLCAGGLLVALLSRGDAVALRVVLAGTACSALGGIWMLVRMRGIAPASYDPKLVVAPALFIVVGSFTGVYYWGAASPVAAMMVYGIYFFSLGSNAAVVAAFALAVTVGHIGLGLGIATGLVEDRGVIAMSGLPGIDQVAIVAIIGILYAVAFYTARKSQRTTLAAMTQLEQAVRSVALREALLAEARAELDRALRVGGPGRFTDQEIGGFRLGMLLGRGGMGEVYEATALAGGSEAAVKLLNPGTLAEPTHVARFLREAELAARVASPHVVRVLAVGTTAGEVPFLAMERLRGRDLAYQLRRRRRLALGDARVLALEVAAGLEAARAAGIVHRDLKPHNVFLADEADGTRRWKILDFGVSKSGASGTLTRGHVIGTPAYMAPEQARGEDVDHRADVYALAAILYRAVTGHPVFAGRDVPGMLYDVVYRVPTQPTLLAAVPADLDRVLALGLAKDASDRFSSAIELAAAFAAVTADGAPELDVALRRRADAVIEKSPWGTRSTAAASSA